jgi:hypothetical protein
VAVTVRRARCEKAKRCNILVQGCPGSRKNVPSDREKVQGDALAVIEYDIKRNGNGIRQLQVDKACKNRSGSNRASFGAVCKASNCGHRKRPGDKYGGGVTVTAEGSGMETVYASTTWERDPKQS